MLWVLVCVVVTCSKTWILSRSTTAHKFEEDRTFKIMLLFVNNPLMQGCLQIFIAIICEIKPLILGAILHKNCLNRLERAKELLSDFYCCLYLCWDFLSLPVALTIVKKISVGDAIKNIQKIMEKWGTLTT